MSQKDSEAVYTAALGDVLAKECSGNRGWRQRPSGSREEVFFDSIFGWHSLDERFALRQSDPRLAP